MLQKLLTLISLLYFLQSCNQSLQPLHYSPNEGNGVTLSHHKDFKLATNGSFSNFDQTKDTYLDAQMGYSPLKHLGFQVGYFFYKTPQPLDTKSDYKSCNIGIGGYHKFCISNQNSVNKNRMENILLEFYGNASFGKNENRHSVSSLYNPSLHYSNVKSRKYYLRGNCHIQFENKLGLSFGTHIGHINYIRGTYSSGRGDTPLINHFRNISDDNQGNFREYTFRVSYKLENFKLHLGVSNSKFWKINPIHHAENYYFGCTIDLDGIHQIDQRKTL